MKSYFNVPFLIAVISVILIGVLITVYRTASVKDVVVSPKWLNQAQFAGMFVAQEEGFYKKKGLNVSFKEFTFEANQAEDLLSGEVHFAIISAEELILLRGEGKPIKALAAIYQVSPYSIVSLEDKNIKSPADFNGKILGNKGGKVEEELFYKLLLNSAGISENEVTFVRLGFERSELEDLIQRKADTVGLYRTDQLYFFEKNNISYSLINPERFGVNIYNDVIVATEDFIKENPEVVMSFISGTVQGWELALKDYDIAVRDTLRYVTNEGYKDSEYEIFILNKSSSLIKPNSRHRIGIMNKRGWNDLYGVMKDRGFIKSDIDVEDIFTTEFIP